MARGWGVAGLRYPCWGAGDGAQRLFRGGSPPPIATRKTSPHPVGSSRREGSWKWGGSLLSRHNPRDVPALPALPLHLHLSGKRWQGVKKLFFSFLFLCVWGNKMAFKEGVALLMALGTREGTRGCSAVCACGGGAASIYTRCPPFRAGRPLPPGSLWKAEEALLGFHSSLFFCCCC